MEELVNCPLCGKEEEYGQMYEYRGALSCGDCLEKATEKRDVERAEVIEEQKHKTDRFKDLDLSDSQIGKANKEILKQDIEAAKKEGLRIRQYEEIRQLAKEYMDKCFPKWEKDCDTCGASNCKYNERCIKCRCQF